MTIDAGDVLSRSRELGDLPYEGRIRYQGLEIGLTIHQKRTRTGWKDSHEISAADPLIATDTIDTRTDPHPHYSADELPSIATQHRATTLPETVTDPREPIDPSVFVYGEDTPQTETNQYIVTPYFSFVYELAFAAAGFTETGVTKQSVDPPISLPDAKTAEGRVTEPPRDVTKTSHPIVEFEFDTSMFTRVFGSIPNLLFEVRDPRNAHSVDELITRRETPPAETERLVPCKMTVDKETLQLRTVGNSDVSTCWSFELGAFGTLPDYVEERLNLDEVLIRVEQDETLMASIEPAQPPTTDRWLSDCDHWELLDCE